MHSHERSGVPVPRFIAIIALLVAVAVAACIWDQLEHDSVRRALLNPDSTGVERIQSVEFWATQGPSAVPQLRPGLAHESATVREHVLLALGRIGRDARAAAPEVARRLEDQDERVREAAATALMRIDPALKDRAPRLAQVLARERHPVVRTAVVNALIQIGASALPAVLSLADTSDPDLRLELIRFLNEIGREDRQALGVLRTYSTDPNGKVRIAALVAMGTAMTLEEALAVLVDEEADAVRIALERLSALGSDGALSADETSRVVPALVSLLPGEDRPGRPELQNATVEALAAFRARARGAAADLARVLRDEDGRPRMNVVRALISIGGDEEIIVTALRDEILDTGENGDYAAAQLLWEYSPEAARALVPELIAQLDSDDSGTQVRAAAALYAVAPAASNRVNELIAALKRPESRTQWPLVAALERIGPEARDAVPVLIERIERRFGGRASSRQASSELDALGGIGVSSDEVLKLLRRAATDENAHNRCSAIASMGRIPFAPEQILDALTNAMSDPEPNVRAAAAMAFGMFHSEREKAVAALRTLLADDTVYVRKAAVRALGQLGADARGALSDLRGMVQAAFGESASAPGLISSNERPDWYPDFLFKTYTASLQELLAEAIARIDSEPAP